MDTLKPELNIPQQLPLPTSVIEPTPIEQKPVELLLNVDEEDNQSQVKNPCSQILADLTDLRFDDKNNEIDSDEKQMEGKDQKFFEQSIKNPLSLRIPLQSRRIDDLKTCTSLC